MTVNVSRCFTTVTIAYFQTVWLLGFLTLVSFLFYRGFYHATIKPKSMQQPDVHLNENETKAGMLFGYKSSALFLIYLKLSCHL